MIETFLQESKINGVNVWKTMTKIENVHLDPQNPRDISDSELTDLTDLISKYNSLRPLLVDIRSEKMGNLIGGNQRLKAELQRGSTEVWIEPKDPITDAQAFEMGTIDNMQFGQYLADPLEKLLTQFKDELDLKKLAPSLQKPLTFEEVLQEFQKGKDPVKPMKYEILIRCESEQDLMDKMGRLSELGINAKKRGK